MRTVFSKYHGTGNDFILIDDREHAFDEKDEARIARLCDRHFGIGADGLILIRKEEGCDFRMVYVNADGKPSSMCGNGGRCAVKFAADHHIVRKKEVTFLAVDGMHEAVIGEKTIKLRMKDVHGIEDGGDFMFLDTGSPHYVKFSANVPGIDVYSEGKKIRNSDRFRKEGTNVNFIEKKDNVLLVRTYERGVENETLSCGTGATASALVAGVHGISTTPTRCDISTPGGNLSVHFHRSEMHFSDIWLEGPAEFVFKGETEL
ncbi:MAG TPA: diaminopimelate epimerase [Bacteroidia bacterium]|nr:diaminopimelate epimerase [Bacteroidia bacterium]